MKRNKIRGVSVAGQAQAENYYPHQSLVNYAPAYKSRHTQEDKIQTQA
jgi:hypothetical protein